MRKKSEDEKNRDGNPGKRPVPVEIEIEEAGVFPPKEMSKDAKKYWKKYAPDLIRAGKLTVLNEQSFKKLCIIWAKIDVINKMLDESFKSLLQETNRFGETVLEENEYSKMLRAYMALARQYEKDFGLTPDKMAGSYKPKKAGSKFFKE